MTTNEGAKPHPKKNTITNSTPHGIIIIVAIISINGCDMPPKQYGATKEIANIPPTTKIGTKAITTKAFKIDFSLFTVLKQSVSI